MPLQFIPFCLCAVQPHWVELWRKITARSHPADRDRN
jgi:hypothetical protein